MLLKQDQCKLHVANCSEINQRNSLEYNSPLRIFLFLFEIMQPSSMYVMLGLSGGVDSSVSAHLLKQAHHRVEALFMKNWIDLEGDGTCPIETDLADAKEVSNSLGLRFHSENFAPEYWDNVFTHFLSEYKAGRTPNPDILCNREVKFKVFLEHALALGADKIATGHYAKIDETDGLYKLLKPKDKNKDQTYFLYTLNQYQLSKSIFPLEDLAKTEVRTIAEQTKLVTHNKKDSTGICFIGEKNFREFLSQFIPAQPGEMIDPDGKTIGEHQGIMYYTLGQRKGLRIGGLSNSQEEPWFVVGKQIKENKLVVAQGHDHPLMYSDQLTTTDLSWTAGFAPKLPLLCKAKTRYRQEEQECIIQSIDDGTATVKFNNKQRAMTPGQSIVFYLEDECLGGGIINNVSDIIYQ